MYFGKVALMLVLVAAAFAALPASVRAQSAATVEGDPVARAMQRIETAIEWRVSVADRVIAASKLLNESVQLFLLVFH